MSRGDQLSVLNKHKHCLPLLIGAISSDGDIFIDILDRCYLGHEEGNLELSVFLDLLELLHALDCHSASPSRHASYIDDLAASHGCCVDVVPLSERYQLECVVEIEIVDFTGFFVDVCDQDDVLGGLINEGMSEGLIT